MAVLQYFVAESDMMMQACIPRYSEDESGEPAVTSKRGGGYSVNSKSIWASGGGSVLK